MSITAPVRLGIFSTLMFGVIGLATAHPPMPEPEFHAPQAYDVNTLHQELLKACPTKNWECFEEQLQGMVPTYGPRGPVDTFMLMQKNGEIPPQVDPHHFVHHLGHHTAMSFGSTPQAFALCPTVFHYGCFHGFFQHALGMKGTTEKKAVEICQELEKDPTATQETKFSCYHGLGHGVMMYEDWWLSQALKVCDTISSPTGQAGCWQGVFMENINVSSEKWKKGGFSKTNPLAPCDTLAPKYQHECFINHNGWLMSFYNRDITKASQACLKAPPEQVFSCLSSIGLSITNATWQSGYMGGQSKKSFSEVAWELCQRFPEGHRDACVLPGVDNLMLTYNMDTQAAQDFCLRVEPSLQAPCFRQIGLQVRYITADYAKAKKICNSLKRKGRAACLTGIGPS